MGELRGSHDHVRCSIPFKGIHAASLGGETQTLLTFPQRLLRPPALGDVLNRAAEPNDASRRITLSFAASRNPSGRAVGTDHLQIEFVWSSSPERFFNRMAQPFPTFGSVETGMLFVTDRR